jgi:ATP-dependent 26S proteasome regulatory subunit
LGHSAKLGILLYGPPGTGKTLVTRYLIQCSDQHTVICPTDMAVETLRESFRLANYLQPSILVLEDVDLLAHDRESFARVEGLQELMNQMDGLASSCDTIVIMSTNRPSVLEPALASRPGRVSQAIEFLLPGEDDRRALLQMFLGDAIATDLSIDHWVQRTHGSSPAFLQELCKRAILLAGERSENDESASLQVNQADLSEAIHELVIMGGTITAKALGFPEDFEF